MNQFTRFACRPALLLALAVAGCVGGRDDGRAPSPLPSTADTSTIIAATEATHVPVASPTTTASPPPTVTPQPTVPPTPTVAPTATADPATAGLPCPVPPPVKPEYAPYTLTGDLWPTPDPDAAPPPLSLVDPLANGKRNEGYPYGSDGSGRYLLHNGLDMADEAGDLAVAPADGTVIIARDDLDEMFGWRCDWYGEVIVIQSDERHDDRPVYLLFGHIGDVQVSEGQRVARGEPIARQGTAGAAVVPHLHLEVRVGENAFGATRNPLLWLEPPAGSGVIAGRLVDGDGRAWQGVTITLIDPRGEPAFRNTWTYLDDPDHLIRPDPALGENFVFGPVEAGVYDVYTQVGDVEYRRSVTVEDGAISVVEIVTEP